MTSKVFTDLTEHETTTWWYKIGTSAPVTSTETFQSRKVYEFLVREETPNFKLQKRQGGLLAPKYYLSARLSANYASGSFSSNNADINASARYIGKPNLPLMAMVPNIDSILGRIPPSYYDYALQKAAAKYYTSGWDALTFAAEIKSTQRMFAGLVPTFVDLAKRTGPGNLAKRIADLHLQVRYGWRTLYMDLVELAETIEKLDEKAKSLHRAVANDTFSSPGTSTSEVTWQTGKWSLVGSSPLEASIRGLVVGSDVPPPITINPILTAWEIVRLSFVVDRFINVGQSLAALQYITMHPNFVSSAGAKISLSGSITGTAGPNGKWIGTGSAHLLYHWDIKVRYPRSVPKGPIVKARVDGWFLTDLVALAYQAARSYLIGRKK